MTASKSKAANRIATALIVFGTCLLMGMGLALLTGCASLSESQQYAQASTTYTTTLATVTPLVEAGILDEDDTKRFDIVQKPAGRLLDQWHSAIVAGKPFDGKQALNALLNELIALSRKGKADGTGSDSRSDTGWSGGHRRTHEACDRDAGRQARSHARGAWRHRVHT